jgi:hypothetical protein
MSVLIDGTGTSNTAQVDERNRLRCRSVITEEATSRGKDEVAFNLNTGELTLTTADESAVMYFYNNESKAFHITALAVGLGPSTGGTSGEPAKIKLVSEVTGGTIKSDASAVAINANRLVGSATSLTANVYKGGQGKTATGGSDSALFYQTPSGRLFANFTWFVPKGKAIAITVEPPTGNTSMTCYAALIGHIDEEV